MRERSSDSAKLFGSSSRLSISLSTSLSSSLSSRRSFISTSLAALPMLTIGVRSTLAYGSKPEQNWPQFRGPDGRGIAEGFPTAATWNADAQAGKLSGVSWRAEIPGLGHSSPIIWGDRMFVGTAVRLSGKASLRIGYYGDVKAAQDNDEQRWMVLCLDKKTGKKLWERVIRTAKPLTERHEKSSHANTTLITNGRQLVAFFGSEGLYCFDLNGKLLWNKDLGVINNSWHGIGWGYSSSPALFHDRIVLLCDDPKDPFVAAFDLSNGKEVWRTSRKGACEGSWGTPMVVNDGARIQVVTNGWPYIVSYDLQGGKELWRLRGGGDIPIPTPFLADGLIVICNAHGGKSPLFAVRPTAQGDISLKEGSTSNDSVAWSVPNGGSYISTPIVYKGYIYLANFNGVLRCYDFKTAQKIYEQRLGADAACSSSLVAADDKIYCATEDGTVHVIKAGPKLEILSKNQMGEPCLATPAISQGVLYFRTASNVIAIG
ncbi:MAG TPA: PQQ-binding-like beta-propeller repeat protein [Blastocatellia bacterium]|nr:PQQ-binding-like beta-propeller repeat protein [Blastocatellia bacterium]